VSTSASLETIFKDRLERTVKISLSAEQRPYSRKDVLDALLSAGVPREAIEAIGVRERNVEWEVTMTTVPARDRLIQLKDLLVKGESAIIGGVRKGTRRLRIFYLPYYVPVSVITQQFVGSGVRIVKSYQDKDRDTGLLSNVWNVIIEVDVPDCIPDQVRWSFGGMSGRVLVNMIGREMKCLRCSQRGHRKFECNAPYCTKCRTVGHTESDNCFQSYAARVSRSVVAPENEMDDVVDDMDMGGDEQPTTSASWSEQMDQVDAVAEAERAAQQTGDADDLDVTQTEATPEVAVAAEEPTADTSASTETADRPVAVTTATDAGPDKSTKSKEDDDWNKVKGQNEDRKRRSTQSPSERNCKMLAASSSKAASPRDPAAGRRRTLPMPVASGRLNGRAK